MRCQPTQTKSIGRNTDNMQQGRGRGLLAKVQSPVGIGRGKRAQSTPSGSSSAAHATPRIGGDCEQPARLFSTARAAKTVALRLIAGDNSSSSNSDEEDILDDGDDGEVLENNEEAYDDQPEVGNNILWAIEDDDAEDDEDIEVAVADVSFAAPSGRIWNQQDHHVGGRPRARNIVNEGGDHLTVKREICPELEKDYILMFLRHMMSEALIYSNLAGRRMVAAYNRSHPQSHKVWKNIDEIEMEAFIGLHLISGACKSQFQATDQLWSEIDGLPVYRATMSQKRFKQIKSCFRVDDPLRRNANDVLSPVRHVFENFCNVLRTFVTPSSYLTVDEQLVEYHGRVRFRQYIGTKPGKFGMKLFWICDTDGGYCLNGLTYTGANTVSQVN